jgi:hypothetical protein
MVPYVDDEELIYVLLREIARGNLDRALVDLIADPAVFSRRAVRLASPFSMAALQGSQGA